MWDVDLMLIAQNKMSVGSGRVGSCQSLVSSCESGWVRVRSGRVRVSRVVSVSSCGRVGSGLCRLGRYWVGSGWVGSSPCQVVVGLGRASAGRVGVGSDRVGSGRLRVEL